MPRTSWMLDSNFKETISTLSWELNIAGINDYTVEFELIHEDSAVDQIEDIHTIEPQFNLFVSFTGIISVEPSYRPSNTFSFPFCCCLREFAPYWLDDVVPVDIKTFDLEDRLAQIKARRADRFEDNDFEEWENNV